MGAYGCMRLGDLCPFLSRPGVLRIVSPHGVEILYEGKAGALMDMLALDSAPKRQGKEAVSQWQHLKGLEGRYVLYGQAVELVAEDWAVEFVPPEKQEEFLMKNKGRSFEYLFLEVSETAEEE